MRILMSAFVIFLSLNAYAVDGYKDYKFGISSKELKAKKPCSLDNGSKQDGGAVAFECPNLVWSDLKVSVAFFFVNDKLLRVALVIPTTHVASTMEAIKAKYGEPSTSPTKRELATVDSMPNTSAEIGFEQDTVIFRIVTDEDMVQTALVIYTSHEYEKSLTQKQLKKISDDI